MSLDCFYCTMRFIKWSLFFFFGMVKRTFQGLTMIVIKLLLNGHIANLVEGTYFSTKNVCLGGTCTPEI